MLCLDSRGNNLLLGIESFKRGETSMRGLVWQSIGWVSLSLLICSFLDLGIFGDLLLLALGLVTLSSICSLKDSNSEGVILIVDKFRALRRNFSWEARNGNRQQGSKRIPRRYSLVRD